MLTKKQLKEIKEYLEDSQNPLFLYDNDADGFCSFLVLRRALGRGKGVAIKSFPDLKEAYAKKVEEFSSDAVFILDKAEISKEFIEKINSKNIPLIWIDHHKTNTPKRLIKKTRYYNSLPSAEPTTYIVQKIFNRKQDIWLAMVGCIGDAYLPEFAREFEKKYPELFNSKIPVFDALYKTKIGDAVRMINFGLMDTTTNVVALSKYLINSNSIYDLFEENRFTKKLHKRYNELNNFYKKQVEKAEKNIKRESKIIFFSYSGKTSMSSEIANRLYFNHKDKIIIVAFKRQDKINLSLRGKNVLKLIKKIIKKIPDSAGGGHKDAVGAVIPPEELGNFKKLVKEIIG